MRIDREAFLLAAVSTLSGCERADSPTELPLPTPTTIAMPGASAVEVSPEPIAVAPVPVVGHVEAPPPAPPRPVSAATRWFFGLSSEQRNNVRSLCEERVAHPCAGLLASLRAPEVDDNGVAHVAEDPEDKLLAGFSDVQRQHAGAYCQEQRGMPAPTCETPLVAAFDNQPIDFVDAGRDQFAFVPGMPMTTDWPTAATPWIARDLDGDGAITSGAELFGSSTLLGGGATARNGFEALAALDANTDGVLDARDPAFAQLVLWSDRDGDHRSTPDELRPLASVITAIPLAPTLDARCNMRDDCEGERGTLSWRDASGAAHAGVVVDVYLRRK